jgi:DNA-directed RNA polymerase subunit RPC12/RpoP
MKKTTSVTIILVCLLAAGFSFYKFVITPASGGAGNVPAGETTWVKCRSCGAEYEMSLRDFVKEVEANRDPRLVVATPALPCKKCGKNAVYQAYKCPNCGTVFFRNSVPGDLEDRCPDCKYSAQEEARKTRSAAN